VECFKVMTLSSKSSRRDVPRCALFSPAWWMRSTERPRRLRLGAHTALVTTLPPRFLSRIGTARRYCPEQRGQCLPRTDPDHVVLLQSLFDFSGNGSE